MMETQESMQGGYMMRPGVHGWLSYIQDGAEKKEFVQLLAMTVG
jgi:hypothetical protein